MFMHDHERRPEAEEWCPLMQDVCRSGFTAKMGVDQNGKNRKCKAWQAVTVVDPRATPTQKDVFDCAVFGWPPDLMVQVANETYHGAAATESVRNHVAENTGAMKIVQSFFLQLAHAAGHKLSVPEKIEPKLEDKSNVH